MNGPVDVQDITATSNLCDPHQQLQSFWHKMKKFSFYFLNSCFMVSLRKTSYNCCQLVCSIPVWTSTPSEQQTAQSQADCSHPAFERYWHREGERKVLLLPWLWHFHDLPILAFWRAYSKMFTVSDQFGMQANRYSVSISSGYGLRQPRWMWSRPKIFETSFRGLWPW